MLSSPTASDVATLRLQYLLKAFQLVLRSFFVFRPLINISFKYTRLFLCRPEKL